MKGIKNKNRILAFASSASLAVLLLLSPCFVRNSIQDFIGHQQTEVSNKSKATITSSTCEASVTAQLFQPKSPDSKKNSLEGAAIPTSFTSVVQNSSTSFLSSGTQQIDSGLSIPYYILYQSLKVAL